VPDPRHGIDEADRASARAVGELAGPLIGLVIALVILKITWESWRTVRHAQPG